MPWYISMVSALRRSGRSKRTVRTPSFFSAKRKRESRSMRSAMGIGYQAIRARVNRRMRVGRELDATFGHETGSPDSVRRAASAARTGLAPRAPRGVRGSGRHGFRPRSGRAQLPRRAAALARREPARGLAQRAPEGALDRRAPRLSPALA